MKISKLEPKYIKKNNPRIGLITLASDFRIEEDFNNIDSISYNFRGYKGLWLGNYEDNSQITFFVPNDEKEFTLNEMSTYH